MKYIILFFVGFLAGIFISNYQHRAKTTRQQLSWKEEQVEYEKVFAEIRERNEAARKTREEFISKLVDVDFADPDNHRPKWLLKLELEQLQND